LQTKEDKSPEKREPTSAAKRAADEERVRIKQLMEEERRRFEDSIRVQEEERKLA